MSSTISPDQADKPAPRQQKLSIEQRCRSVPYKRTHVIAVLCTVLFFLTVVALLTCVVAFFMAPAELKRGVAFAMAGMLPVCAFFWTVAYFKRRKANCPLCKCTPFLDNLAHKHQKAIRVRPLNYGTTAVFNVVFKQRWRCMYCGTPFDLLKDKVTREFSEEREQTANDNKDSQ